LDLVLLFRNTSSSNDSERAIVLDRSLSISVKILKKSWIITH